METGVTTGKYSHNTNIRLRTGVHPGNYEYNIIQQLAQQQKIKFYEGLMKKMWLNAIHSVGKVLKAKWMCIYNYSNFLTLLTETDIEIY